MILRMLLFILYINMMHLSFLFALNIFTILKLSTTKKYISGKSYKSFDYIDEDFYKEFYESVGSRQFNSKGFEYESYGPINYYSDYNIPGLDLKDKEKLYLKGVDLSKVERYMKILNLKTFPEEDTLKKQYRKLAKKHHPDMGGDRDAFEKVTEAYDYLIKVYSYL